MLGPGISSVSGEAAKLRIDTHLHRLRCGEPLTTDVDLRVLVMALQRQMGSGVQLTLHLWDPLTDPIRPRLTLQGKSEQPAGGAGGVQQRVVEVRVARVWRRWVRVAHSKQAPPKGCGVLDDYVAVIRVTGRDK